MFAGFDSTGLNEPLQETTTLSFLSQDFLFLCLWYISLLLFLCVLSVMFYSCWLLVVFIHLSFYYISASVLSLFVINFLKLFLSFSLLTVVFFLVSLSLFFFFFTFLSPPRCSHICPSVYSSPMHS